uniref:Uncharacterized protein n=1 Tax=Oryza glumipatula TaxID=40148 RepID=A0A0D9Y7F3_9ORYZ
MGAGRAGEGRGVVVLRPHYRPRANRRGRRAAAEQAAASGEGPDGRRARRCPGGPVPARSRWRPPVSCKLASAERQAGGTVAASSEPAMGQTGGRPGGGGGPALQRLRRHAAGEVASRSLARCREGARRRGRQAAGQRHSGRQGSNESTTQPINLYYCDCT